MIRLNKFGYTKVEIIVVIFLLGIISFITINKTSYAFMTDNKNVAKDVISIIENQAEEYAKDNMDIFNESNITYISVSDLIDAKYLLANDDGLITNPEKPNKSYNDSKIKLEQFDKEIKATFTE